MIGWIATILIFGSAIHGGVFGNYPAATYELLFGFVLAWAYKNL